MFYTVKEVASLLRCSEKYAYKLIGDGIIPAVRLGSKIIVQKEDLDNALQKMKTKKEA